MSEKHFNSPFPLILHLIGTNVNMVLMVALQKHYSSRPVPQEAAEHTTGDSPELSGRRHRHFRTVQPICDIGVN